VIRFLVLLLLFAAPLPLLATAVDRVELPVPQALAPTAQGGHPVALNGRYSVPFSRPIHYWMRARCDAAWIAWRVDGAPDPTGAQSGCGGALTQVVVSQVVR